MTDDHVSTHDAAPDVRNDDILIYVDGEIVHRDEEPMPPAGPLWTDDFSSLFEVVEFNNQ